MICKTSQPLLAKSVAHLLVHNSNYDPEFRPILGKLQASYNGCFLIVTVEGPHITAEVTTFEEQFKVQFTVAEVGMTSWKQIFQEILARVLAHLYTTAMSQLMYLRQGQLKELWYVN